jgi:hypothetical protein
MKEVATPSAFGLPPLSAFFIERPELIVEMSQSVFRAGPTNQRRMVISGLGGIGKTQIVVFYVISYRGELFLHHSFGILI